MAIIDYGRIADRYQEALFNDTTVSEINKTYVKSFLLTYDVSEARRGIFLRHIRLVLQKLPDMKQDIQDPDKINQAFYSIRTTKVCTHKGKRTTKTISTSYYGTIISCALRFARWLNDGERPKGFKDIKGLEKKKLKRDLEPEDMVTWEDGLKLISHTSSIQLKAAVMVQLDAGFRPSEFIGLTYGDFAKGEDGLGIMRVKAGKTGKRDVVLYHSLPYLTAWLEQHPVKEPDSPLWLMERPLKSKLRNRPYKYPAIQKQVKTLGKLAKIDKPLDFYNLRHSACTLSKLENLNTETAANKFGHSVAHYTSTYARLDTKGLLKRFARHYKLSEENITDRNKPLVCSRCGVINEPGMEYCRNCQSPLTLEVAMRSEKRVKKLEDDIEQMKRDQRKLIMQHFQELLEQQPADLLKALEMVKKGKEEAKS